MIPTQRVLRGTSAVLTWQNLDADGEATAPVGTVTVGVVDASGAEVIASGTATAVDGDARTCTLTPEQTSDLNLLTATWTDDGGGTFTTLVEVVGGYYFSVAEARAAAPAMSDDVNYPTDKIIEARRQIEEEFERICGVAFVPRYAREQLWSTCEWQSIPAWPAIRRIRSLSWVDAFGTETPFTTEELALARIDDAGLRILWSGLPYGTTIAGYEHGYDQPPAEVKRAAFQRLRYLVAKPNSAIPDRATTFSIAEGGTYSLAMAGAYKTGQPDVDAVLDRWSMRVPGVA